MARCRWTLLLLLLRAHRRLQRAAARLSPGGYAARLARRRVLRFDSAPEARVRRAPRAAAHLAPLRATARIRGIPRHRDQARRSPDSSATTSSGLSTASRRATASSSIAASTMPPRCSRRSRPSRSSRCRSNGTRTTANSRASNELDGSLEKRKRARLKKTLEPDRGLDRQPHRGAGTEDRRAARRRSR